ncbi:hypothetical protein ACJJTC_002514 [Scirpophaga incertulas]
MSPIQVIDCLASTPTYTLGDIRKYLMDVLKAESEVITREQELCNKYRDESEKMKAQIQRLQQEPVTFQSSRCAACNRSLELPTVHFLCQHSFHQQNSPLASPQTSRKADHIKISTAIANSASKNPFDDEYDESKNPFADDSKNPFAEDDTTNPFGDDGDYDKNLNPFS